MLNLFKRNEKSTEDDSSINAMADGIVIPTEQIKDPVFSQQVMGKTIAFQYEGDTVTICSPASGKLSVLFPTGHAFGITMANEVEVLVHIGIDTVNTNGEGFTILSKKQGDQVKAGDPIVEVNLKKLRENYDTSTMLIVTNEAQQHLTFKKLENVEKGEPLIDLSI